MKSENPYGLSRDELLAAVGRLYTREIGDWELTVHHTLTEPTCPSATIKPENSEGSTFSGFSVWGVDLDAAIDCVLLQAYEVLILRQPFEPHDFFNDENDQKEFERIIAALDNKTS